MRLEVRRLVVRIVLGGVLAASPSLLGNCQVGPPQGGAPAKAPATVTFEMERLGLPVPKFAIQIREDGTGTYQAEQAAQAATSTATRGEEAQHVERVMTLSAPMAAKIFKAARDLHYFQISCASKLKNIADTGKKTLTYSGADGSGSCLYHYSENKEVAMLTEDFIGIAFTMDEGRRLDFLHRYDRLGLDAEMIMLTHEAEEGRALEIGTISQTLTAIVDDSAIIQRVRVSAQKMLEQSK